MTKPKSQEQLNSLLTQSVSISDDGFTERVLIRLNKLEKSRSNIYLAAAIGLFLAVLVAPIGQYLSALGNLLIAFEGLAAKQQIIESVSNFSIITNLMNLDASSLLLIAICAVIGLLHIERA